MRRPTLSSLLLAGVLALGGAAPAISAPAAGDATPGSTPATGSIAWTLTSQEVSGGGDIVPLALAPDGAAVAVWDRTDDGAVCSYPIITREAPTCAAFEGSVAPDSIRWSPDSSRFAFTENAVLFLYESDIHVFDVEAGEIINLTDDGVEGGVMEIEGAADIDVAPAWSPDGTEIVFARGPWDDGGEASSLYRVPADGSGEPEEIAQVSTIFLAVYGGIHWVEDDRILYSLAASTDDPDNGIWSIPPEGGEPERLVDANDYRTTTMILVDVSADGTAGLVLDQRAFSQLPSLTVATTHYLLDLDGGDLTPLDFGAGELSPSKALETDSGVPSRVTAVGFSPAGDQFAAAVTLPGNESQLWIVDVATGEPTVAGDLDETVGAPGVRSGIDWGANDLLFAPTFLDAGVVMVLEPGD